MKAHLFLSISLDNNKLEKFRKSPQSEILACLFISLNASSLSLLFLFHLIPSTFSRLFTTMNTSTSPQPQPPAAAGTAHCQCHSPQTHCSMAEGMACTPMTLHHYIHFVHHCSQSHATPLACMETFPQNQQQRLPLQAPWGTMSYVTQWTPPPGWQPSSSLPTAQPGHHSPLSLIQCPYNHQCQHPLEQTCQNAVRVHFLFILRPRLSWTPDKLVSNCFLDQPLAPYGA